MIKKKYLILLLAIMGSLYASAQNVGINNDGTAPDGSAMLDVKSTAKGILIPRMSQSFRDLIPTPATGLLIWQTDNTPGFYYNAGTPAAKNWKAMGSLTASDIPRYHVYSSAGRLGVTATGATVQPGLTQTFTLARTATILIWASIGGRTTVNTSGAYATVDVVIYANGTFLANGGWNRFTVVNPTASNAFGACSINTSIQLPAGTHTIDLRTLRSNGTSPVDIGGNSATDVNPGELTIMVLYQ